MKTEAGKIIHNWLTSSKVDPMPPPYVKMALEHEEREDQIANMQVDHNSYIYRQLITGREEIDSVLERYRQRCVTEDKIADYLTDKIIPRNIDPRLARLPMEMRDCHRSGQLGMDDEGGLVIAWDQKCNCTRLCPHEANEDGKRLGRRYVPVLLDLVQKGYWIHYAVFTEKNYRPGTLKRNMRRIFERFNNVILRGKKNGKKAFPTIAGALVVQENPLGADSDWNVHLNVILVTKGGVDYKALREKWNANIHIERIATDPGSIEKTFRELIKYSVKLTGSPSEDAGEWRGQDNQVFFDSEGERCAPPLTQWPAERFLEWWYANKGFRRARSYGCLYRTPKPETRPLSSVQFFARAALVEGAWQLQGAVIGVIDSIRGHKSGRDTSGGSGRYAAQGPPRASPAAVTLH